MKRIYLILLVVSSMSAWSGCLFRSKSATPKDNSAIAGETAEKFRQRWTEKRAAELQSQGLTVEDARAKAAAEFRERYEYTSASRK